MPQLRPMVRLINKQPRRCEEQTEVAEKQAQPEVAEEQAVEVEGEDKLTDDIDGTWVIDEEFGEFDFDTASGSFAGFRVAEEMTIGSVTAVGRTGDITGSLTIEEGSLIAADVTVDMTTIVSNDPRREHAITNAVRARIHPTASFVLTDTVALDVDTLTSGATLDNELLGDLTVNGVTNQVSFRLQSTIVEPDLGLVVGSTEISWADFNVTPPRASIVVSVADQGIVEFQLIVRRS